MIRTPPTSTLFPDTALFRSIDPHISGTYESFLRRICPTVVKVEDRDDTGGFLKTRLQTVEELCATIPNAYWTNQYGNLDAMRSEEHTSELQSRSELECRLLL